MSTTTTASESSTSAGASAAAAGGRTGRSRWTVTAGRAAVPLVALALWLVIAPLTDLVPSLVLTLLELWDGFATGWIYPGLAATATAVVAGFLLGAAFAFPMGYVLGRSRTLHRILDPLIAGTFAVPRIILYPVLLTLFGVGVLAETSMVAISAFFPIIMATAAAVRHVNENLLKLGRSLAASRFQIARKIVVPAAAPSIMVGIRIGFSISFIAAIIAEFFAAKDGLGLMISEAYSRLALPEMYAIVLLIMVTALGGNLLLWWAERKLRAA